MSDILPSVALRKMQRAQRKVRNLAEELNDALTDHADAVLVYKQAMKELEKSNIKEKT